MQISTKYMKTAAFQRRLLICMNLFQMIIGLVLVANVIHHW